MNTSLTKIFITQSLILLGFVLGCALATSALSEHLMPKLSNSLQSVISPELNAETSHV
jgi:hypothetical protein